MRITSYQHAFEVVLSITLSDAALAHIASIESEGYTERGICYTIARTHEKLSQYKRDPRFWGILRNEVRKHAYRKGDSTPPPAQRLNRGV